LQPDKVTQITQACRCSIYWALRLRLTSDEQAREAIFPVPYARMQQTGALEQLGTIAPAFSASRSLY
jgi:hypothetical protein